MALIKCTECGSNISDQANACPKCGCPIKINKTNEDISNLNNYHIESSKNTEQIDKYCLGGMISGTISLFIDLFGIVSTVALVISFIGYTRANGKSKTFAITGMAFGGCSLIYRIIQLAILIIN